MHRRQRAVGEHGAALGGTVEIKQDQRGGSPGNEHGRGVGDVPGRRSVMRVAGGLASDCV